MTTKELLKILDLMKKPREGIRAVKGNIYFNLIKGII
jgi:hypothetical protein